MGTPDIRVTPTFFHLLLSLAEGPKHAYAVLGEIEKRTDGAVKLGPSSLYYAVGRLEDAGWIEEVEEVEGSDDPHEEQRRYYALTRTGRTRLEEELEVLSGIVARARELGLEAGGGGA